MKTDSSKAGPLVGGTLLIAFGLLSLASQLFRNVVNWSYLWPVAVIFFGALFFAGMFLGGRRVSGLAIPGSIMTGIGLMLLYQNLTSHWESWAYSWTLIVVLVGVGIYAAGVYGRYESQKRAGIKLMKIGLILFVLFGAFFEMIFSMDRSLGFRGLLFPSLLIVLGIYLIIRRLGIWGGSKEDQNDVAVPPESPSVLK
jgi:cell wall-active antibiotic response 4TMS protein YvqF